MTRAAFRQIDVKRAIAGAIDAGLSISGVRVEGGAFVIVTDGSLGASAADAVDDLDQSRPVAPEREAVL